ncbi:dna repair protein rad4 [Diplodia corticola]|uniref:Dna repair protein rad4 n=1 Tax=Diplodia corticola TaxID=236234 RepID=A0A1J9S1Y1_9PEZI|nr:dna repair protein rad4 [Diplodia corticola]OJD34028.1 dna repair protein rad4 [Diplodia corticola]
MARAKAKLRGPAGPPRAPRRSTRNKQLDDAPPDAVPDVFREMLSEAESDRAEHVRPLKKRKVEQPVDESASPVPPAAVDRGSSNGPEEDTPKLQTIIDESESDDSDMDWEDVDLDQKSADAVLPPLTKAQAEETLQIEIGNDDTKNKPERARRKAATAAERAVKLHIHKMHLLCLLYNSHIRNAWCNDDKVQSSLKRFRSARIIDLFAPDPNQSQFAASKAFTDGLHLVKEAWKRFKITSVGLRRARWAQYTKDLEGFRIPANADPVMDASDFRKAAVAFEGSPDTGAMLFCAFLRALGVDARLVCSLQPLPFAGAQPTPASSTHDQGKTVYADDHSDEKMTPSPKATPLRRITRIGRPGLNSSSSRQAVTPSPVKPTKAIPHPRYPVFWVEAFNPAQQKWITADPIVTGTIAKPSRLEPPLNDPDVSMTYAVAFEDNGVAKDVTRRYAKAYNAKTRKSRVESTENGSRWWRKAMKLFKRKTILDRDQVEDAELSRREAQEEMPRNVQDFKDHPYYVLERHLKHNEVIHPKRECGQVNVGTAANTNLESIYRRRDVHQLKSADKWYRLGREIKPGEQPLKHAKPRRSRQQQRLPPSPSDDNNANDEAGDALGAALYAPFQTTLYIPPPCVRGRVPRNAFGNLDVYVPSMVPPGGAHVRDPRARLAARLLAVDFADAVTGFTFRGRHGTAVVEGVVVAEECADAVRAVLDGLADLAAERERERKGREAVRLWKRFLLGLRVLERVGEYASVEERRERERAMRERVEVEEREEEERRMAVEERRVAEEKGRVAEEMAGGFLLAEGAGEAPAQPTAGRMLAVADGYGEGGYYDGDGGGFLPDEGGDEEDDANDEPIGGGGFVPEDGGGSVPEHGGGFITGGGRDFIPESGGEFSAEDGGGFLPTEGGSFIPDEEDGGGGFVREDTNPELGARHTSSEQRKSQQEQKDEAETFPAGPTSPETMDIYDEADQQHVSAEEQDEASQPTAAVAQELESVLDARPQRSIPGVQLDLAGAVQSSKVEAQSPEKVTGMAEDEKASSADDDKDSLPSHDPEDEDAEPEWLAEEVVSD